ncbi:hypothetical protein [Dysosmobacter welbionis]|jgi:hypothetical protein|uniref:hypothetical protein n=1 Tax=Dysosmobacter welbionis TaxID=2093857 RepID=UPI00210EFB3E|nr:hypothetical protein [Dysosmobacter welbionis]MCQ5042492.1 hypothetical protein [Dysosmobacter welbionis]
MLDYNVDTTVQFKLPEMSSEFNSLAVNDLRKVFVEHVKNVFEKDETLGDPGYVSGPLNFKFSGQKVKLQYVFKCCDENNEEAESFAAYCVRCVKEELEDFGYEVKKIECSAEEADMSWLDWLEDAVFESRDPSPVLNRGANTEMNKKGKAGPER